MSQVRSSSRDAAVDGLRGLMLLVIVVTHYVPTSFFSGNIARPAAAVMLAVTGYFFMKVVEREKRLSKGFGERISAGLSLLWQRHMRIWPAIAGVILFYIILGYVDPGPINSQIHHTWPLYLGYMGNVVKMLYEQHAFPPQFWLISAQEQFVFAALIALVLVGPHRIRSLLQAAVIVGVTARVIGCLLWMPDQPALATESPFAVADALALGMLCRSAISGGASRTRLRRLLVGGALATLLLWASLPNAYAVYFGLLPLLAALGGCIFILSIADEMRARRVQRAMLSWPAIVLLGQMSLSLFLLHPLVNTMLNLAFARHFGELMPWWMLSLVGPPLSVLVAYAYFRMVEVPIRQLRSSRGAESDAPDSRRIPPSSPITALGGRRGFLLSARLGRLVAR